MIKAIVFDIGGVIIPYLDKQIDGYIKEYLEITDEQFNTAWSSYVGQLTTGMISESYFWEKVVEITGTSKVLPEESLFLAEYGKNLVVNYELINFVNNLKKHYKLAVLSNSIKPLSQYNKQIGLYDIFDLVVLSEEVGMMKPSPSIFLYTLSKLGLNPGEVVFIDDKYENVTAANDLGIKGQLYKSNSQILNQLRTMSIPIN